MISIVIPVYNEARSLARLWDEIVQVAAAARLDLEAVFVDDGSTDDSWKTIRALVRSDARVKGIRFRRNFGKAAALSAGFATARGDTIVTLDADLQDDPAEIPALLAKLHNDLDLVSGWKRERHDPWHKVLPSRVFNRMVSWVTGVALHDHNCGMKAYRSSVLLEVRLYGERHRFIPVLAAARGFRVGEMEVRHRARRFGESKYGMSRLLKGFLDLLTVKFLTGFGQRPQHVLGSIGLLMLLSGTGVLAYLSLTWVVRLIDPLAYLPLSERPLMIYSTGFMLLGAQMFSMGILAEMLASHQTREEPSYSIAEQVHHRQMETAGATDYPAMEPVASAFARRPA
ncbi:MAG: glycosyltransferase family 2 protein [Burkholderiales bacterium]